MLSDKPCHHGSVHRVGHRAFVQEKRAAVKIETLPPDRGDAIDIGLSPLPHLEVREITLQGRAHGTKAGMHLPANRAEPRPLDKIFRQQMRLGFDLVEILTDGERIPYAERTKTNYCSLAAALKIR